MTVLQFYSTTVEKNNVCELQKYCWRVIRRARTSVAHFIFFTLFLHILNRCSFFFSFSPVTGLVSMGLVQLLLPISQAMYQWLVHLLPHQPVQCPPQQCLPFLAAPGARSLPPLRGTAPTPWRIPRALLLLPARAPWAFPSHPALQILQPWLLGLQPCQPPLPDTGPQPRAHLCLLLQPVPGAGVLPYRAGFLLGIAPEQSVLAVCSAGCGTSLHYGTTYPCAQLTLLTPSSFLPLALC